MEQFFCRTKILAGHGALSRLKDFAVQRLFLVADPYFVKSGDAQNIADLTQADQVEIFSDIAPDPTVSLAARGAVAVKAFAPDAVIALGGGSALDSAKAMVYFSGLHPLQIAIPTTSGSGSEVTDFAILTHDGIKHPLVDDALRPDVAILDDSLLQALPQGLIADTGFDLLSHALESRVATGAGTFSNALSESAFCTAFSLLPHSYGGSISARMPLHSASAMAGLAFSCAGLGVCHALSHALGGEFHIPHGRLNAILLPAVVEENAPAVGSQYAALARRAGFSSGSDSVALRALKNELARLRRSLHLPQTLAEAGIPPALLEQKVETLIAATMADPCCSTNPVAVEKAMVRRILGKVAGYA